MTNNLKVWVKTQRKRRDHDKHNIHPQQKLQKQLESNHILRPAIHSKLTPRPALPFSLTIASGRAGRSKAWRYCGSCCSDAQRRKVGAAIRRQTSAKIGRRHAADEQRPVISAVKARRFLTFVSNEVTPLLRQTCAPYTFCLQRVHQHVERVGLN